MTTTLMLTLATHVAATYTPRMVRTVMAAAALLVLMPGTVHAQNDIKIRDLTSPEGALPVRLVGYGLAVGLDNTGDRAIGGQSAGPTVQSVINILRRFNIEVPADLIRMRNVAAVLVTAEVSPYLRPGGRFEVQVSSIGDARSLRGGTLFMTPLVADPNGPPPVELTGGRLKLWNDVRTRWALEPASENILRNACESLERAAVYGEIVRQEGGVYRDRFGGIKPHPAAMLERDFRGLAARQLAQLAARMEGN